MIGRPFPTDGNILKYTQVSWRAGKGVRTKKINSLIIEFQEKTKATVIF